MRKFDPEYRLRLTAAILAVGLAWPAACSAMTTGDAGGDAVPAGAESDLATGVSAPVLPLRDPFWPVGYTPPPVRVAAGQRAKPAEPERPPPDWAAAAARLRYRGSFSSRGVVMASVNEQIVEVGNVIGLRMPPWIYQWRIKAIHRYGIETEPIGVVPAD